MSKRCISDLRRIFLQAVDSVQPFTIFSSGQWIRRVKPAENADSVEICGETVSLTSKKCHLIGFGKAVLGMAVQMDRLLGDRLVSGVISIPCGTREKFKNAPDMTLNKRSIIEIYEGARDNLPDANAVRAAEEINKLAESMTKDDILFVLISGGGSALLPLPVKLITLDQKSHLIRTLARCGADIEELNIVRIAMSDIKGGKLARSARNAYRIFSLVISDIVGDPMHLIASGPTVPFRSDGRTAKNILEKYKIWDELDPKIQKIFSDEVEGPTQELDNSFVHLIGSNRIAANAALQYSQELGYKSCILSTSVTGTLTDVTETYTKFLLNLQQYLTQKIDVHELIRSYPFGKDTLENFLQTIRSCSPGDSLCLILAGEPTAIVHGNGIGGRNQELALRMSKVFYENETLRTWRFLSAGTDGIDGPTDAAGALGAAEVIESFLQRHTLKDLQKFIDENDSYNFYKKLGSNEYHIVTGHTGTNVMDIHLFTTVIPALSSFSKL